MSKFFDSEFIQQELREINELQEALYGSILSFGLMPREDKLEHIDKMTELLEKQKIMYTRLSLSDDPDALEMKENLRKSVSMMGFPSDLDMNVLFNNMAQTIRGLKKYLD
jgi:hypothetical protein